MRLRNIPAAKEFVAQSPLALDEAAALAKAGAWRFAFPNQGPLHLEIGAGRGRFLAESALASPDLNFLGLELREEMIMQALAKLASAPANLLFLWMNAARLGEVFAPGEVDLIYLNFPDPWPKARHAKRRLTAPDFLAMYGRILKPGGALRFKTDNPALFQWTELNFSAAGWQILERETDLPLARSGIVTEYESRYRRQGQPIYYIAACPPEKAVEKIESDDIKRNLNKAQPESGTKLAAD